MLLPLAEFSKKYSSPSRDLDNKIGYLLAVGDVWMITVW